LRTLSADWVVPVEGPPIADGAVAIGDDGLIDAVGSRAELGSDVHYPESVIVPGFVNAHTHLEYDVYAGFGDGLSFGPWVGIHVSRKRNLRLEDMEAIARLGALNCLRTGITTVGDCSFSGAAATACADLGLRGTIYLEVFGDGDAPIHERFEPMRQRLHDLPAAVQIGISPHAPYTTTMSLYEACGRLELPIATHLSESRDELQYLTDGTGPWSSVADMLIPPLGTTGTRALAERGLLGPHMLAAHCVHVDAEEIDLLASHDVAVAHCPRSNAGLGCGIAPLSELRNAGIRVCIATDSPNSAASFDMFEELRVAMWVARAREQRPDALTAADALELATLGGARALGLEDSLGSLVPGKQADLTVLSLADTAFIPWEDPVTSTVLGGSPQGVIATLVSGQPRYEKGGKTWLELIADARSARGRLLQLADPTS
jgi:cytosine/adenosine deaminase-related metal-dependent hydrolase